MQLREAVQRTRERLSKADESTKRLRRLEIGLVAVCAFSPLLMIAVDDEEGIREAISYYWDMPASVAFYVPLTVAAILLVVNGVLNKENEYNWILGTALMVLVVFNRDQFNLFHLGGVLVFFAGNVVVVGFALAKNFLKIKVIGGAALFFVAGIAVDANWSMNWLLWLQWASLLVIAMHFILVVLASDDTYQAPLSPQKRAEKRARAAA